VERQICDRQAWCGLAVDAPVGCKTRKPRDYPGLPRWIAVSAGSGLRNVGRLRTFLALNDLELDSIALGE
jgi:hypothetical protein